MKKGICMMLAAVLVLSLAGCGGQETKKVDLKALYDSCAESLPEMMVLEGDTRLNFLGLREEDCSQVFTAISMDGMITDEIWLVEAKDQQALDRISKLAEKRLQIKADETVSYAPDQYAVVQEGKIVTGGLYLALLVSPNVDTLKTQVETAFN